MFSILRNPQLRCITTLTLLGDGWKVDAESPDRRLSQANHVRFIDLCFFYHAQQVGRFRGCVRGRTPNLEAFYGWITTYNNQWWNGTRRAMRLFSPSRNLLFLPPSSVHEDGPSKLAINISDKSYSNLVYVGGVTEWPRPALGPLERVYIFALCRYLAHFWGCLLCPPCAWFQRVHLVFW